MTKGGHAGISHVKHKRSRSITVINMGWKNRRKGDVQKPEEKSRRRGNAGSIASSFSFAVPEPSISRFKGAGTGQEAGPGGDIRFEAASRNYKRC
jgi:hypothetical protein